NAFASPGTNPKFSQQAAIMEKLGIHQSQFYDKKHNLKSLPDLLGYVKSKTKGMTESQRLNVAHMFFGATGQEAGITLMNNIGNTKRLQERVAKAQDQKGGGYNARLAKKNMKSWSNQIKVFKQYLNVMGMGFTKTVLPAFTKVLGYANKLLDVL
ncbi:hypothetical protein HMPREF0497_1245, partial [Lentilactobacillus buchneri ATCC 11577]